MGSESSSGHASGADLLRAENIRFSVRRRAALAAAPDESASSDSDEGVWDPATGPTSDGAESGDVWGEGNGGRAEAQDRPAEGVAGLFAACSVRESLVEGIRSMLDGILDNGASREAIEDLLSRARQGEACKGVVPPEAIAYLSCVASRFQDRPPTEPSNSHSSSMSSTASEDSHAPKDAQEPTKAESSGKFSESMDPGPATQGVIVQVFPTKQAIVEARFRERAGMALSSGTGPELGVGNAEVARGPVVHQAESGAVMGTASVDYQKWGSGDRLAIPSRPPSNCNMHTQQMVPLDTYAGHDERAGQEAPGPVKDVAIAGQGSTLQTMTPEQSAVRSSSRMRSSPAAHFSTEDAQAQAAAQAVDLMGVGCHMNGNQLVAVASMVASAATAAVSAALRGSDTSKDQSAQQVTLQQLSGQGGQGHTLRGRIVYTPKEQQSTEGTLNCGAPSERGDEGGVQELQGYSPRRYSSNMPISGLQRSQLTLCDVTCQTDDAPAMMQQGPYHASCTGVCTAAQNSNRPHDVKHQVPEAAKGTSVERVAENKSSIADPNGTTRLRERTVGSQLPTSVPGADAECQDRIVHEKVAATTPNPFVCDTRKGVENHKYEAMIPPPYGALKQYIHKTPVLPPELTKSISRAYEELDPDMPKQSKFEPKISPPRDEIYQEALRSVASNLGGTIDYSRLNNQLNALRSGSALLASGVGNPGMEQDLASCIPPPKRLWEDGNQDLCLDDIASFQSLVQQEVGCRVQAALAGKPPTRRKAGPSIAGKRARQHEDGADQCLDKATRLACQKVQSFANGNHPGFPAAPRRLPKGQSRHRKRDTPDVAGESPPLSPRHKENRSPNQMHSHVDKKPRQRPQIAFGRRVAPPVRGLDRSNRRAKGMLQGNIGAPEEHRHSTEAKAECAPRTRPAESPPTSTTGGTDVFVENLLDALFVAASNSKDPPVHRSPPQCNEQSIQPPGANVSGVLLEKPRQPERQNHDEHDRGVESMAQQTIHKEPARSLDQCTGREFVSVSDIHGAPVVHASAGGAPNIEWRCVPSRSRNWEAIEDCEHLLDGRFRQEEHLWDRRDHEETGTLPHAINVIGDNGDGFQLPVHDAAKCGSEGPKSPADEGLDHSILDALVDSLIKAQISTEEATGPAAAESELKDDEFENQPAPAPASSPTDADDGSQGSAKRNGGVLLEPEAPHAQQHPESERDLPLTQPCPRSATPADTPEPTPDQSAPAAIEAASSPCPRLPLTVKPHGSDSDVSSSSRGAIAMTDAHHSRHEHAFGPSGDPMSPASTAGAGSGLAQSSHTKGTAINFVDAVVQTAAIEPQVTEAAEVQNMAKGGAGRLQQDRLTDSSLHVEASIHGDVSQPPECSKMCRDIAEQIGSDPYAVGVVGSRPHASPLQPGVFGVNGTGVSVDPDAGVLGYAPDTQTTGLPLPVGLNPQQCPPAPHQLPDIGHIRRILWRPDCQDNFAAEIAAVGQSASTSDFYGSGEATTSDDDFSDAVHRASQGCSPLRHKRSASDVRLGNYRARRHWILKKAGIEDPLLLSSSAQDTKSSSESDYGQTVSQEDLDQLQHRLNEILSLGSARRAAHLPT
eukprot:evm.model.scf_798EXC.1 EVM.evm.TU.scf_798EXC.1   scf_798EXC:3846-13519(-)